MNEAFAVTSFSAEKNSCVGITYPGVNNFSDFTFDGFGHNVKIVETTSGSVTSTKQFLWCFDSFRLYQPCEERDGTGTLMKKFYARGQQNSTTKYFYSRDHLGASSNFATRFNQIAANNRRKGINPDANLGSIREMSDNAAAIQAEYSFDPFGQTVKLLESVPADFQYAGYYAHLRSGFAICLLREYSSYFGRWISRDPLLVIDYENPYIYTGNSPILRYDPSGGQFCPLPSMSKRTIKCINYATNPDGSFSETAFELCMQAGNKNKTRVGDPPPPADLKEPDIFDENKGDVSLNIDRQ